MIRSEYRDNMAMAFDRNQGPAKRFKIFKNGDPTYIGKEFVLNRRRVRNWDSFLQQVTIDTKSIEAVRSIRTPVGGTQVLELEQLETDRNYVAVCNGRFRKLGYQSLDGTLLKRGSTQPKVTEIKPVEHSRVQVSGRIRKIPTDILTIFVYTNGKELEPARRVMLTRTMLGSWDSILRQVTEKVNLNSGATRKLCTTEGEIVTNPSSLQASNFYVAVGSEVGGFKNLDYGAHRPAFNSSPKRQVRRLKPIVSPPRKLRKQNKKNSESSTQEDPVKPTSESTESSVQNRTQPKREPVNRKPAPKKKEEDSVFFAKPIKHKRSSDSRRQVDLDKDEGGVFKAKDRNAESKDAEVIEDTKDTKVDLPIDQVEAEEVEDEEIESGKPTKKNERKPTPPKHPRKDRDKEDKAATKIQSNYRGYQTRKNASKPERAEKQAEKDNKKEPKKESKPKRDEDEAATKIQANYRGHKTRKDLAKDENKKTKKEIPAEESKPAKKDDSTEKTQPDEDKAATKIQANYRGYQTRKSLKNTKQTSKEDVKKEPEGSPATDERKEKSQTPDNKLSKDAAATKIQARYRGYQVRKEGAKPGNKSGKAQEEKVKDDDGEKPAASPSPRQDSQNLQPEEHNSKPETPQLQTRSPHPDRLSAEPDRLSQRPVAKSPDLEGRSPKPDSGSPRSRAETPEPLQKKEGDSSPPDGHSPAPVDSSRSKGEASPKPDGQPADSYLT